MTFQDALNKVVEDFGVDFLQSPKLINILNDYNAFESEKAYKFILATFVSEGTIKDILQIADWEFEARQIIAKVVLNTGLDDVKVTNLVNYIANCANIIKQEQYIKQESSYNYQNTIPSQTPDSIAGRQSGLATNNIKVTYSYNLLLNINGNTIADNQFAYDDSIQELIIPEGVNVIESEAFRECRRLQYVSFPSTLTEIKKNAFTGCRLKQIEFHGQKPPIIDKFAFGNKYTKTGLIECTYRDMYDNLHILIPIDTENLYINTFEIMGCTNPYYNGRRLNMISICNTIFKNNSITKLSASVQGSSGRVLKIKHNNGVVNRNSFINEGYLWSLGETPKNSYTNIDVIIIPEGTTNIEAEAFPDKRNLTFDESKRVGGESHLTIILPESLKEIGALAFPDGLLELEFKGHTPPKVSYPCFLRAFMQITVPQGAKTIYEESIKNWFIGDSHYFGVTEK